jgi:hypothetical protein
VKPSRRRLQQGAAAILALPPFAFVLGFILLSAGPVLAADKYVGSNIDVRTILAFKVADAAVQKALPEGWELDVATIGPAKDVNLRVTFVDRLSEQDAEGKSLSPARHVTVTMPAKKKGAETRGTMLFVLYSSDEDGVPGPYGVAAHANTNMDRQVRIDPAEANTVEETWQLQAPDGNSLQLQIQYVRSAPARVKAETLVHSAAKPDFFRIYRFEQWADTVRGAGADRVQKVVFEASGPKLAPLFDGSEQLIGVTTVPWYLRQIYLPGS